MVIEIETVSTSACVLCRNYLQDASPDIAIRVTEDDINREFTESRTIRHNKVSAETTAVYRKIVESVLDYNAFWMHSAVISTGMNACMFSAPSVTGKTTHISCG